MIDIKSNETLTHTALVEEMAEMKDLIHQVENGLPARGKPIQVFLSGNKRVFLQTICIV